MRQGFRVLSIGLGMLVLSIVLDLAGTRLQSLILLVISFAVGIAGAVVAFRGLMEFFSELV